MSTLTVTHINVLTPDLERSYKFYTEVLGFKYVQNLGPKKIVLDAGGFDFFIEEETEVNHNEKFHFGMKIPHDEIVELDKKLRAHNVPIVKGNNPTAELYTTPDGQRTALYFLDPSGWTIEAYSAV